MKAAVDCAYTDTAFFGSAATDDGYKKRLRAVVQNTLTDYSDDMRKRGHSMLIVEDSEERSDVAARGGRPWILRSDLMKKVKKLMDRSRGRELPGTFNPMIVEDLFRDQCKPWKEITSAMISTVVTSALDAMKAALAHVAVESVANAILTEKILPDMEDLKKKLEEKVLEVLEPHYTSHPITYNELLMVNVQQAQYSRLIRETGSRFRGRLFPNQEISVTVRAVIVPDLVKTLVGDLEPDMHRYASSLAIDYMEAYYQVSMSNLRHS